MKLVTPRELFLHHLQLVAPISPVRTARPVFKDVLLEASPGQLRLVTTDGEISMTSIATHAGISGEGRAALPAGILLSAVRSLESDELTLEQKGPFHELTGGASSFKLHGEDPEVFPEIGSLDEDGAVAIPKTGFLDLCARTMFAAAKEMGRYAFNGVLLEIEPKEVTLVATDGRRLSLARMTTETGVSERASCILPLKGLAQLQRAASEGDDDVVKVQIRENQVLFALQGAQILSRLVEGEFPDFRAVLPKEKDAPLEAQIDRSELERAIRRAAVTAGEEARSVELSFDAGKLKISSRQDGLGESESEMPVEYQGEAVDIRFNPEFIGEYLKSLSDSAVTFRFKDRASAGYFATSERAVYVIMPITS